MWNKCDFYYPLWILQEIQKIIVNLEKHSFKLRKMILTFKCRNFTFLDLNILFLFPDKKHFYSKYIFITKGFFSLI